MVIDWLKKLTRTNSGPGREVERSGSRVGTRVGVAEPVIPQDLIARRAYEKWVARGRPSGTSLQDWLEAEAELRAEVTS